MKSCSFYLLQMLIAVSVCIPTGILKASTHPETPEARVISTEELVGRWQENHIVTPVNQILTPAGL